ncbi:MULTISPECIES: GtrA family protein [Flammeovirga]|uniref:GtrA family protein n=1 Tax=Flammeovirga agarivorans TaxID=2726742 RepID=A0A7X8SNV9_9BACT|nr:MULTISPECIES: GtrA family protein [Flammeovirga]NLR93674.1 GtrA family protein [Flammeovirga agarivorans]
MREKFIQLIDLFYFIFKPFMPLKTYRYAVCGGGNLVLDIVLYFLVFHYGVDEHNLDLEFVTVSPHIAALFIVYPITLTTGFLLQKYITFQDSDLRGRVQFFRYFQISVGAIIINYFLMKLFVDVCGFYPTPSKMLTIAVSVVYSYISQNLYSFKVTNKES